MSKPFTRTPKQREQTAVLASLAKHAMSFGGSRSGKTFGICRAMTIRALKVPSSRHLAVRLKFNHAKTSLWYETFPKVFDVCFPGLPVKANKQDFFWTLPNGSEIWIGGLDEKERVEKILGKEYSTLFFNECSQIPYGSVQVALTRLAQKNALRKRVYYDENPPTKKHWSYPLFIKKLDPDTWEPIPNPDDYASILMNPADNLENIDDDYLEMLSRMPERERKRFLDGEFTDDSSGNIYHGFERKRHVKDTPRISTLPLIIGMDFNVSPMTAVICQISGDKVRAIDEFYVMNSHTQEMASLITSKYPGRWTIIPDSTGKALKTSAAGLSDHQILKNHGFQIPAVHNPFRADRYNAVNYLFEKDRIEIDPKCVKLIRDLEQVSYKEGTNLPDDKDKTLTHVSDGFGYLVHWAFPIVKIQTSVSSIPR